MALIATNGTKAGGYTYDPYGKTTPVAGTSTTAATANPWRYIGGYQDPTDGFYKFGARYYDSLGHFNQQDPVAGSITRTEKFNRFTYSGGDPVNGTDASGNYVSYKTCRAFVYTVGFVFSSSFIGGGPIAATSVSYYFGLIIDAETWGYDPCSNTYQPNRFGEFAAATGP